MLEKANKLRSNDPYITDSLGWALFKLKRYKESKDYLQLAVKLMPGDPIVNDHYGDVLWKNGKEIQARYYWNYVLNLKKTEDELKKTIEQKLKPGDVVRQRVGQPHQLEALTDGTVFEVSTQHFDEDSYRVVKGDTQ